MVDCVPLSLLDGSSFTTGWSTPRRGNSGSSIVTIAPSLPSAPPPLIVIIPLFTNTEACSRCTEIGLGIGSNTVLLLSLESRSYDLLLGSWPLLLFGDAAIAPKAWVLLRVGERAAELGLW